MSVFDHQLDGVQVIADTRAGYAGSGVDFKQCVMRGALYEHVIHVEKLVFLPLKISAGMRTAVYVSFEYAILVHNKQRNRFAPLFDFK